jgi:hypothetical protein
MEYQKRLRFINYIKENFSVHKNETIVFYFENIADLDSISAQKIKNSKENVFYRDHQKRMNQGLVYLSYEFDDGIHFEFSDHYLSYEEFVTKKWCVENSLAEPLSSSASEVEIKNEFEAMIRQLNGEEPVYYKSNC